MLLCIHYDLLKRAVVFLLLNTLAEKSVGQSMKNYTLFDFNHLHILQPEQ